MFGTDAPWADQSAELALFQALPLGRAALRQALWDNGCRLAGIAGGQLPGA
jgi:predicted TIM-barrel fold metal-dependent hydrolase